MESHVFCPRFHQIVDFARAVRHCGIVSQIWISRVSCEQRWAGVLEHGLSMPHFVPILSLLTTTA